MLRKLGSGLALPPPAAGAPGPPGRLGVLSAAGRKKKGAKEAQAGSFSPPLACRPHVLTRWPSHAQFSALRAFEQEAHGAVRRHKHRGRKQWLKSLVGAGM